MRRRRHLELLVNWPLLKSINSNARVFFVILNVAGSTQGNNDVSVSGSTNVVLDNVVPLSIISNQPTFSAPIRSFFHSITLCFSVLV